ncbi:unnamed protein product [Phaeothamnion confervicola]
MKKLLNEIEIGDLELTTDELECVSGGMRNNQTEAWAYFKSGIVLGVLLAGGNVGCNATP